MLSTGSHYLQLKTLHLWVQNEEMKDLYSFKKDKVKVKTKSLNGLFCWERERVELRSYMRCY